MLTTNSNIEEEQKRSPVEMLVFERWATYHRREAAETSPDFHVKFVITLNIVLDVGIKLF